MKAVKWLRVNGAAVRLKDLDPSVVDFAKSCLLGMVFNPSRRYFAKFQKADAVISDIIISLDKGKTVLKNDNTTLEIEQQTLRELTKRRKRKFSWACSWTQRSNPRSRRLKYGRSRRIKSGLLLKRCCFRAPARDGPAADAGREPAGDHGY